MSRPLAIIPVYNEADILPAVLRHLEHQGCDVYVLDNWSTDLSPELLSRIGCNIERWPAERPTTYDWTAILMRIEEIALERGKGRWVILHDADEIRRVPNDWSTLTIAQAFEIVSIIGYNAVHFKVQTFVPTDDLWKSGDNPERHFRYFKQEHVDHGLPHIKGWFQDDQRVDIHTHGGHQAVFSNRHVCPHPFLLKHYPIRSQEHGERKVLTERFPRYPKAEREKRWHVQYDEYVEKPKPVFVSSPVGLCQAHNNVSIVAVARTAESFHALADSVDLHEPLCQRIAVVSDAVIKREGWKIVMGELSAGIAAAGTDDVLYLTDEIELVSPIVEELAEISSLAGGAIASAQLVDDNQVEARWKESRVQTSLVCALFPRSVLSGSRAQTVIARCRVRQYTQSAVAVEA